MKSARRKKFFIIACTALLLVLLAQPSQAATKNWVGPKGNTLWTNANNWGPTTGQPVSTDDVNLISNSNKTAYYNTTLNQNFNQLTVDASGGSTFTLFLPGNALSASFQTIGDVGKGQVVQTGGTNSNTFLTLGANVGSRGTYTLQGGSLTSFRGLTIGASGTGLFTQTGGSNTAGINPFFFVLGGGSGAVGTYNLNGGHLQADTEQIGDSGTGTFNQSTGSTHIVSNALVLGFNSGGSGTYNMKGGYLQAVDEIVGDEGKGTFTQSGGTHLVTSNLTLGDAATGNGAFTLLAGSLSAFNEFIGNNGVGQFTQSGGTNSVASILYIGYFPVGSGTYTLNAGRLQSHDVSVGLDGTGIFTQTGGTHTVSTALSLGDNGTANGTYNLKNGTLSLTGTAKEYVGFNGTGTFNQTGGTHTVATTLFVGNGPGFGTGPGTYNLQGGTLSAGTPFVGPTDDILINSGGTFNVKNTTTTVTGDVLNDGGLVKTTNAKVTWNGNFINRSAYISDPSTQTFNGNLTLNATGYLVGGSQDVFILKNDFSNFSIKNTQWNTVLSTLKFATGADNIHTMMVPGLDAGPHGQADNFTWGTLILTGQKLNLDDAYTATSTAFYAEAVIGAAFSGLTLTNITNLDTDPINIYYNANLAANAYLHGLNYTIPGGGQLIAHTPVPPSVLLLGSGLLGLGALGWRRRRG
jgi:hypothetical protein